MESLARIGRFIVYATVVAQLFTILVRAIENKNEFSPGERNALILLRDAINSTFNLHANWTGPVCHKNQSRWFGIVCSDWHVTHIVLEGVNLTGSLPPAFLQNITFLNRLSLRNNSIHGPLPNLTNLSHLEILLLSRNSFSGSIPLSYTELPRLITLELQENFLQGEIPPFDQESLIDFNVSHNQLQGSIPETPTLQRFSKSSYHDNSNLCGKPIDIPCPISPPPQSNPPSPSPTLSMERDKTGLKVWMIASIAAAVVLTLVFTVLITLCCYRRVYAKGTRNEHPGRGFQGSTDKKIRWSESPVEAERNTGLEFFDKNDQIFDLDELLRSSAEVIGRGKLGPTYKAVLDSGPVVAVKRLNSLNALSKKEFKQQLQLLGKMKHENLVEIISYYYSEEKLIIYEYIPAENLFELLHENRGIGRVPLNWTTRLSIIKDIAKGLNFLHQSTPSQKVPHGNLKSSNVLIQYINQDCHSKLTDYGFLSLMTSRETFNIVAIARSPEFSQGKKLTASADIYCFGIVVLEIITGRIPGENSSSGVEGGEDDLSDWVKKVVDNDWSTDIIDVEILAEKQGFDEMLKLTEIALECTDLLPEKRPLMNDILRRIEEIEFEQKSRIEEIT